MRPVWQSAALTSRAGSKQLQLRFDLVPRPLATNNESNNMGVVLSDVDYLLVCGKYRDLRVPVEESVDGIAVNVVVTVGIICGRVVRSGSRVCNCGGCQRQVRGG
jgi:hypothetical protein